MNKTFFGSLVLSSILAAGAAYASSAESDYYTIVQVETHEVSAQAGQLSSFAAPVITESSNSNLSSYVIQKLEDEINFQELVNLGKQFWALIEANKPVVNVTTDRATIVPKGISEWTELNGWQPPQTHIYETNFTNLYGINVVKFQYRVTFTSGGSYNGRGKYLANVTVVPSDLYVAWGFKFNASVSIPSITNAGTSESPVAGTEVVVKWSVDTVMAHSEQSGGYYARGDGYFLAENTGISSLR